jgi:aspartyl-tRNA(Asn)/glutamyl-tRNA(Gln) amidotransferase subunit C
VNVEGVEPTAHAFPRYNVWDEDIAVEGFSADDALLNAPKARSEQVVVPKVVKE